MLYTLSGKAVWDEEIRKSRFLTLANHASNPEQALEFIKENSVLTATHNCWAYQIGDEYRFNDDGEPGGTAGRPILQAIQGQQCDQVVVLVIRWFGGTKLGTGGLIRAYGGCAAQCLRQAEKHKLVATTSFICHCPYTNIAIVQSKFAELGISVLSEQFDADGVQWNLSLPEALADKFTVLFTNITSGQGVIY